MNNIMQFLNKPLFKLNGFQVTVLVVLILALAFLVWRKYMK